MPSPAQIMFMSSLINNVPESSPALLSIYSLIFIFKTKSFCLNKLILMVQFVESQCTSENCKLSQFKILKYFFESSFFSKVFLDVNTGSHYMILNRNMVKPIIMLPGELFEEVLLTLLVTSKWRKINRCIYIHCYFICVV